ncbi:transposase [Rhodospirillaceae bacterium LM-1]|nr:transposase [Rhodospirillaceae bacterium LM-1]
MSTTSTMDTTLTGRRRNRSWPEELKREIVAASLAPGSSVSAVARRYDVNSNQLFGWRKMFRDGSPALAGPDTPQLVPVVVSPERRDDTTPALTELGIIEIDLIGSRYRLRVGNGVDARALQLVLDVLERR